MLVDCHVHLDDPKLSDFVRSFQQCPKDTQFRLITNSVDLNSSKRNLEMAGCNSNVTAFVGIHPEVFAKTDLQKFSKEQLNKDFEQISSIAPKSSGIGEIGLDPKYGQESIQDLLFK